MKTEPVSFILFFVRRPIKIWICRFKIEYLIFTVFHLVVSFADFFFNIFFFRFTLVKSQTVP